MREFVQHNFNKWSGRGGWRRPPTARKLYVAQLKLKVAGKKLNAPGRTVNRLFDSLQMFRRLFANSADDWTGRVALRPRSRCSSPITTAR